MQNAYPCVLTPEEGGGFSVSFPDVPEALTCGNDLADALAMAEEALTAALAIYLQLDEDLPAPSPLREGQYPATLPAMVAAKLAIYSAMRLQSMDPRRACRSSGYERTSRPPVSWPRPWLAHQRSRESPSGGWP